MTVRTNAVQTCDRCEKPFNEKYLKSGDEVPSFKQSGLVITETTGTSKDEEPKFKVVASFDDICPDCRKAVDNLIAKIKLDSKPKKKKKAPAKKRGSKKADEEQKPEVPEYTEDPPAESKGEEQEPAPPDPDAPPAKEGTEPAETTGEAQESQEAAPAEETSEETPEEPAAEAAPEATEEPAADGGNGAEAASNDDNLMTDPDTGDVYDKTTGEVVSKGSTNGGEKHPF